MNELHSNVKVVSAINPAAKTAGENGATIDLQGYQQIEFVCVIGAITAADGSNLMTLKIQEGAASDLSDAADVTDTLRLLSTPSVINAAGDANKSFRFGMNVGTKRYCRIVSTETGTFDGIFGVVAILSQPRHAPVAAQTN